MGKELKKSENDKALQPSVEVTGPSTVMNLEKQTLTFTFRKLLQLSESKLQTSNLMTVKPFLLTMCEQYKIYLIFPVFGVK